VKIPSFMRNFLSEKLKPVFFRLYRSARHNARKTPE